LTLSDSLLESVPKSFPVAVGEFAYVARVAGSLASTNAKPSHGRLHEIIDVADSSCKSDEVVLILHWRVVQRDGIRIRFGGRASGRYGNGP
jgi:hypothetical protein